MMQYSEPWCKSLWKEQRKTGWNSSSFKSWMEGAWTLYFCTQTHTQDTQSSVLKRINAGLNFNRKNPCLQAQRSKSGFRNDLHPRASWYNRRLNLKPCLGNMFIFEDARGHLQLDYQLPNQTQHLHGKHRRLTISINKWRLCNPVSICNLIENTRTWYKAFHLFYCRQACIWEYRLECTYLRECLISRYV